MSRRIIGSMDELETTDLQPFVLGAAVGPRQPGRRSSSVCRRLLVRLGRWRLDRELAEGRRPESSERLALRARQLVDPRVRAEVASALRRLVDDARQPYVVLNSVPLARAGGLVALLSAEVLAWREGLLGLAERIGGPTPVSPCGVARARILLADVTGPLYNTDPPRLLGETIWWIADGLRLVSSTAPEMPGDRQAGSGATRA